MGSRPRSWNKNARRWEANYTDEKNGKPRYIGLYDTQEAAAHAVNAAIRRAGLEGLRYINPVVDGALVPKQPWGECWGAHWTRKKRDRVDPTVATRPSDAELALRAELERLQAENRELLRAELERLQAENQKLKRGRR